MSEARGRPTEARPAPRAAPVNAHVFSAHGTSQAGFTERSAGDTQSAGLLLEQKHSSKCVGLASLRLSRKADLRELVLKAGWKYLSEGTRG